VVQVYQPLSGLHRPVVVDPQMPNLRDVNLEVYCVPGDYLSAEENRRLCRRVGALFENQGAMVSTYTQDRRAPQEELEAPTTTDTATGPRTDLTIELRSRETYSNRNPLSAWLCWSTLTMVPAVTETSFAQDIVIRDGTGFLLVSDTLQGRLVRYFGLGTWMVNQAMDLVWREEADKVSGDAANQDLSDDMYRQLSQLMFNAKMQWEVLQEAPLALPAQ
jgi:hypothetical protein